MKKKLNILLLNGANLNLLGIREPDYYGSLSLNKILDNLQAQIVDINATLANDSNIIQESNIPCYIELEHLQSNREYELLEAIHVAYESVDFIIINPASFTHTSVALRDALLAVKIPFIEVHLSNIYAREPFRHHSYLSDIAIGVISGLGELGYEFALSAAVKHLVKNTLQDK